MDWIETSKALPTDSRAIEVMLKDETIMKARFTTFIHENTLNKLFNELDGANIEGSPYGFKKVVKWRECK